MLEDSRLQICIEMFIRFKIAIRGLKVAAKD